MTLKSLLGPLKNSLAVSCLWAPRAVHLLSLLGGQLFWVSDILSPLLRHTCDILRTSSLSYLPFQMVLLQKDLQGDVTKPLHPFSEALKIASYRKLTEKHWRWIIFVDSSDISCLFFLSDLSLILMWFPPDSTLTVLSDFPSTCKHLISSFGCSYKMKYVQHKSSMK